MCQLTRSAILAGGLFTAIGFVMLALQPVADLCHKERAHADADEIEGALLGRAPAEFRSRIRSLSHEDWRVREDASRWIVRNWEAWIRVVPGEWQPQDAEARWRWKAILENVRLLSSIPERVEEVGLDNFRWELRKLARDYGESTLLAAIEPMLADPDERLRQRGTELLAEFTAAEIDLSPHFDRLARDPSPWVRRSAYAGAIARGREQAEKLVLAALCREESTALQLETVQAARGVATPRILARLREVWSVAAYEVREEIACILAARGLDHDRELTRWMLASGRYRLINAALREVDSAIAAANLDLMFGLLDSPHAEFRARAAHWIRVHPAPNANEVLSLVALPDSKEPALLELARECLVRPSGEGDLAELEAFRGCCATRERCFRIVIEGGEARPMDAPHAAGHSVDLAPTEGGCRSQ